MPYTFPIPYAFPATVSPDYPTAGTRISSPSRPLAEGIKASTISYEADSGHTQSRPRSNPKRTFNLSWLVLTADEYKTIRDFFMVVTNHAAFSWVHPVEKTTFNVKFAMDTFTGENFSHGHQGPLYKLQVSLTQSW